MHLEPGDIFLTRSSSWLGRAIRWATREDGEGATRVNHVGCIVEDGDIRYVRCVEALQRVQLHGLWDNYAGTDTEVAIFRPVNLTADQQGTILEYLLRHVGATYGYWKLPLHLARRWGPARRLIDWAAPAALDKYPICSYLVARAYQEAGLDFGVHAKLATPDDIWDFCELNPDKYIFLQPLGPLV